MQDQHIQVRLSFTSLDRFPMASDNSTTLLQLLISSDVRQHRFPILSVSDVMLEHSLKSSEGRFVSDHIPKREAVLSAGITQDGGVW